MTSTSNTYKQAIFLLNEAFAKTLPSKKELAIRSFIQGLFFGLGTTIGVSIILTIITFTINQLKLFPIFNSVIQQTNVERIIHSSK